MKRDMELIRRIALAVADLPVTDTLEGIKDVDSEVFILHTIWMKEAGLIEARVIDPMTADIGAAFIFRLTWDGCEFVDAVSSDTVWAKVREKLLKPSASFTFGILKELAKAEIQKHVPGLGAGA